MNEWKKIKRQAKRSGDAEVPGLYLEVFGANYSGAVTPARARESIIEACEEMLIMAKGKSNDEAVSLESINEKLDRILAWMEKVKPTGFDGVVEVEGKAKKIKVSDPISAEVKLATGLKDQEKEAKKEEKITIEKVREVATRYSNAFGMNDLLACVSKFDGAKKLSGVAEANYPMFVAEMMGRLDREGTKTEEPKKEEVKEEAKKITLDEIKPKAKAFMDKNGTEALAALLKSFGAAKLSEVAGDKYPALLEALVNA